MAFWDPTYRDPRTVRKLVEIGSFWAREDSIAKQKATALQNLRREKRNPNFVWYQKLQKNTFKWNVGSFGMFSDFDDPAPILKALGTESAVDSEANYYEAEATWEYRELLPNGTWRGLGRR